VSGSCWQIIEHRGRSGLQALETDWRRLYPTIPARARYHAYEAHAAYLDHLCQAPDLTRYLALSDGQQVRAICPLEPTYEKALGLPVKAWGLPRHSHWQTTDVIVPEDEAGVALVPTVMEYLRRHPLGRRFLVLGPLPEESVVWKGVEAYGPSRFCARSDWSAFFIDCTMSYDRLLAGLTKNFRKNLRNNSNRLKQFGEVRFVQVSGRDGLEKELATFLDIEASGWKGEHGTGSAINLHPNLVAFYRDLAAEMLGPEDYCEICSLYAAGHCLASMFSVRTGETYATVKIGYDETFSRLGPGQALLQKTIERCCADPGIKQFDMVGTPAWVKGWQPQQKRFRQGHIAIGGIPSRLPVALLSLRFGAVRHAVRSVRRRLGR
jgi:hypothetical protein